MRRLLGVIVAALVVVGAAPALAANQTVSVGDNFFTPVNDHRNSPVLITEFPHLLRLRFGAG